MVLLEAQFTRVYTIQDAHVPAERRLFFQRAVGDSTVLVIIHAIRVFICAKQTFHVLFYISYN